jgi:hypothetical protein
MLSFMVKSYPHFYLSVNHTEKSLEAVFVFCGQLNISMFTCYNYRKFSEDRSQGIGLVVSDPSSAPLPILTDPAGKALIF